MLLLATQKSETRQQTFSAVVSIGLWQPEDDSKLASVEPVVLAAVVKNNSHHISNSHTQTELAYENNNTK